MRYELSDYEWSVIKPMLPNKLRGMTAASANYHAFIKLASIRLRIRAYECHALDQ